MEGHKISACLVVRNEEALIGRCLSSLTGVVDEIILVHDGDCTDKTLEIAREFGARVLIKPFHGSSEGWRCLSFEQASGDWVLVIDADEYLSAELRRDLRKLAEDETVDAYSFSWPYWNGRAYFGQGPFARELRPCFYRKSKMYMVAISHEYARTYGRLSDLPSLQLKHEPLYNNFTSASLTKRWVRYAKLRAQELLDLENRTTFNITDLKNNPTLSYYRNLVRFPLLYAVAEPVKFMLLYLWRGVLWSGLESLQAAFWLVLFRFYQNFCVWEASRKYAQANKKSRG